MAYIASWGPKTFEIGPGKVVPLLDLSTGYSAKSETNEDTSGQPTTNTTGLELQQISLSTQYMIATGSDPIGEVEDWRNYVGERYPLYISGRQFGPKLMELKSVNFSDFQFDNSGTLLSVSAAISLTEYVPQTTTVSEKKETEQTESNEAAMSAGPSADEKANKKTTPAR